VTFVRFYFTDLSFLLSQLNDLRILVKMAIVIIGESEKWGI